MPRYKLTIEYDGSPFVGWQRQAEGTTVQGVIEGALRKLEPRAPGIQGAGRTDAGVHATGQVCHCDLAASWEAFRLSEALNHHMKPHPVAVLAAEPVGEEFSARFSAIRRHYLYRIVNRRAPLTIEAGRAWRVVRPIDADAMHRAAQALVGRHDFTTFRSSQCQAESPVKTLDRITVSRAGDDVMCVLHARSFLHNQVRSIIGTLERVGAGKWPERRVAEVLGAADRSACGPVAPACGLYLTCVDYPD